MDQTPDEYNPAHHVPDTPVVLALAASAVFAWLYIRYGQATERTGVVGLVLATTVVPLFFALRRTPGLRVWILAAATVAQVEWYLIAIA